MRHLRHILQNIIHKKAGFTLLEILVSVAILSIITGSLFVVFKTSSDSWKKSSEKLEVYQKQRAILEQMAKEIQSAVLKGDPGTYFLLGENGTGTNPDKITFICPIQTDQNNEYDLCKIRYDLNSLSLRKYIDRSVTGSGITRNIAENILNLQFRYWDTGMTNWGNALDTWDSRTGTQAGRLPKAVKIEITLKEQNKKFITVVYLPNS